VNLPRYARTEGARLYDDLERAGCEPRWIEGFGAIECLCPLALRHGERVTMRLEWTAGGYLAPTEPAA